MNDQSWGLEGRWRLKVLWGIGTGAGAGSGAVDVRHRTCDSGSMSTRPRFRFSGPTIDAADPLRLARFYEQLLGWSIVEQEGTLDDDGATGNADEPGWAKLRSADGFVKIEIQHEPAYTKPVWPPKSGDPLMMMHLDIGVSDLEAGVAWAEKCGATQAEHQPQDDVRVMIDPEGHPFCLFPDPRA